MTGDIHAARRAAWLAKLRCPPGASEVKEWLEEHEIYHDAINCTAHNADGSSGKPIADVYLDDRAVRFEGNFQEVWAQIHRPTWWEMRKHAAARRKKARKDVGF